MQRIKRWFVSGENEVEIPTEVETMASVPREPMARRPVLITPYDEVTSRVGLRPPALLLYSANPYATMQAYTADHERVPLQLVPGVQYPVVWQPAEAVVMDESEKRLEFSIPLGRTFAVSGIMKRVEVQAYASIPISNMPWGWARLGVVGRQQFNLDVVSADFDTLTELATKRYEIEHLMKSTQEAAFMELLGLAKHMPEGQRHFAYNEMLRGLGLGGVDELLKSKDPEAAINRKIEELTKLKNEITRSKR